MLEISSTIVKGSGTIPKNIEKDSVLFLYALDTVGYQSYEWEIISKPEDSNCFINSPISQYTKLGPLDKDGVYQIKLTVNRDLYGQKIKTATFNVPKQTGIVPNPPIPTFSLSGGKVRNGSFVLPGPLDGWALDWDIVDTAGILDHFAGITRGRCIPTNFDSEGRYVFCLGDDLGLSETVGKGDVLSISQDIDLTNATKLRVTLKFIKRN